MIKMYSKNCEHMLRIFSQISQDNYAQVFLAKEICRKAKVPEFSARKGLQLLVQHKILKAVSGPGGGYQLIKHPKKIQLLDIIEVIDGKELNLHCVMGFPQCNGQQPCPMHDVWKDIKGRLLCELEKKSLFNVMKRN